MIPSLISFDVEEWFHVFDDKVLPPRDQWDALPQRAPDQVERILDLLDARGVHATFFVLGWFGRRHPRLTRSIHERGHEVACHSDVHSLLHTLSPAEVLSDLNLARTSLEQVCGTNVLGFRAPAFSIRPANAWAFDVVLDAGFKYDSSVFPARRLYGGMPGANPFPHRLRTPSGRWLPEVPVSTVKVLGMTIPFGGGAYFRLVPAFVTALLAQIGLRQGHPFVNYLHPRDFDPGTPRVSTSLRRFFQWHFGIRGATEKLKVLLDVFPPVRFCEYLRDCGLLDP